MSKTLIIAATEKGRKTMPDTTLKPCPFCGSLEIMIVDNHDPVTGGEDWIIECVGCESAFIASNDGMPCSRSELIARWNRRADNG